MNTYKIPNSLKEQLEYDYLYSNMTTLQILDKYNCSWHTLYNTLNRFNIPKKGLVKNKINEYIFHNLNNKSSWLLGLFLTDGYVNKINNHHYIQIGFNDLDLINRVHNLLESTSKISYNSKKKYYYFKNTSKILYDKLNNLEVHKNKTFDVKMPNCSEENFPHLFRGIFDGDGCVFKHKKSNTIISVGVSIVSASYYFLYRIKEMFDLYTDIRCRIYSPKGTNYHRLLFSTLNSEKLFHWMYSGSYLIRHENKYNKFVSIMKLRKNNINI